MRKSTVVTICVSLALVAAGGVVLAPVFSRAPSPVKKQILTPEHRQMLAEYDKLIREGSKAMLEENYGLALEKYNAALALRPNWPEALHRRAKANLALGNDSLALEDLYLLSFGGARWGSNLQTDLAFIAETVLLAERLNEPEKLDALMERARLVLSKDRANDGLPVLSAELSERDRLFATAAKRSYFRGESDKAIAFLAQVADQDNEVIRYYHANAEQKAGNHAYAQALFKDLASDTRVSAETRKKAAGRTAN
jgi:tetratricopeptide (TPR) repeat protein